MRPALILTRQNVIPYLNKLTVAEVTSQGKDTQLRSPSDKAGTFLKNLMFS
jgi:hypothetical protein